jgi:4-hydroxy-tetrahydrodipicolinate reductase
MKIAINGAAGAMGRMVTGVVADCDDIEIVAALEYDGHPAAGQDVGTLAGAEAVGVAIGTELIGEPDVLVDFSTPEAAMLRARECAERGVAVLICATGLSAEQRAGVERDIAARVPVIATGNTSLGINLLLRLVADAARALGPGFDVEIVESHHRRKVDAPSGTALALASSLCAALGVEPDDVLCHGRQGAVGPRATGQIGMHAVRGGSIVGDHTVLFAGPGERIELTHRAGDRRVFANGAVHAARFLAASAAGLYTMADVLDI